MTRGAQRWWGGRAGSDHHRNTLITAAAAILVFSLVWSMAGRAAGQCCGDCNGDGKVSIDELITAVNNALSNCAAATPTVRPTDTPTPRPSATQTPANLCRLTFADSGNLCTFRGRYNRGCGAELDSLLSSNGTALIVAIDTMLTTQPTVLFGAQVDSPTSASLMVWSSDNFQTSHPTAGVVQLTGNGSQLVIFPNDSPFAIQSCNFVQYTGAFTGSARGRERGGSLLAEDEGAVALDRLRAWLERPLPDLADPGY